MMRARRDARGATRAHRDDGAALVEFGIVAPLLFLIVFGIIEFGWAFGQHLDVRHGAREGSRLAAVNYRETATSSGPTQLDELIGAVCSRMDGKGDVEVSLHRPDGDDIGDRIVVRVRKDPLDQLTGFLGFALNNVTLESKVETRIEQEATWESMDAGDFEACS
jgi:hypothetical protein